MMKISHILKIGGGLVAKSHSILKSLWTTVHQAPLSMGFLRQEYWSGLLFPSPGDLPDPGIKPRNSPGPPEKPEVFIEYISKYTSSY